MDERKEHIEKLFARVERYMKIIAGAEFLKFENLQPEDQQDLYKADLPLKTQETNFTMEEMISVASHFMGGNPAIKQASASGGSNNDQSSFLKQRRQRTHSGEDGDDIITQEEKDIHSII